MPLIKEYKDPKLRKLREQQRECMKKLRRKEQINRLWKQRAEHKPIIVQKSKKQIYNITK